jgi:hypothetical protein
MPLFELRFVSLYSEATTHKKRIASEYSLFTCGIE